MFKFYGIFIFYFEYWEEVDYEKDGLFVGIGIFGEDGGVSEVSDFLGLRGKLIG